MSQSTPGPWHSERRNWRGEADPHRFYVRGNAHEDPNEDGDGPITLSTAVAIVEGNTTSHEVTAANARLIAAAPDLEEGMAYFLMLSVRLGAELPGDVIAWAKSVLKDKTRPGYEVARAATARLSGKED